MILPLGFRYSAVYAGIRKVKKDDLALIVSDAPAAAAGVFTANKVQASPVRLANAHLKSSRGAAHAILVNAGNANCATRTGDKVALACSKALAKSLKIPVERVLPASTGVIGVELDPGLITRSVPELVGGLSEDRFQTVSEAIMTTDTRPKSAFAEVSVGEKTVRIAGMTKGAGMIQPNMATTLGFVVTDAGISAGPLHAMLREATEQSYNRLSVDGDMSTNDTIFLLANGASGVEMGPADRKIFLRALTLLLQDLAQQIARDGEGATKLITIQVSGARNTPEAVRIARAIANSPLVKTAIAGNDPNWGRILCAAGYSGATFDPGDVDIHLQNMPVCRRGLAANFSEADLKAALNKKDVNIRFDIGGGGTGETRFWTCDFTEDYIKINASYRT
ncbi:MAG: bifunctional glutamate N-acetyltransferase/amino-acid acetyltransferase ArgJ [Bryobacteraceae bacterium]|nr:bifunctional glutamate N-acetyltransferase/amino-acid acetyltransferase ArgJ [Bryobacteraceae bacterium]